MTTPCSGRSPVWDWQNPSPGLAHTHLPPGQVAAAGAICAGFALLPDIDEPGSTVSRKLGPVSEAVAAVTNKLAGGHRQATHSLWFAGGTAALVWWLGRFALAAPILVYACLALTLTMLVPAGLARRGSTVALIGPVAAGWAVWRAQTGSWLTDPTTVAGPHTWAWLPVAAGTGVVVHLFGDMFTVKGVPLLWPLQLRPAAPCSATPTAPENNFWRMPFSTCLPWPGSKSCIPCLTREKSTSDAAPTTATSSTRPAAAGRGTHHGVPRFAPFTPCWACRMSFRRFSPRSPARAAVGSPYRPRLAAIRGQPQRDPHPQPDRGDRQLGLRRPAPPRRAAPLRSK